MGLPHQFLRVQGRARDALRRIHAFFRRSGVRSPPVKTDRQPLGRRLGQASPVYDRPLRVPAQVVESVHFGNVFLLKELHALLPARADLLRRLKYQIDISARLRGIQRQRKGAERRAMAVVAAFVGDALMDKCIRERHVRLTDRQRIHIRPEGDTVGMRIRPLLHRVEPSFPLRDLQPGILSQELHQTGNGPRLVPGQFRVVMEIMAEVPDFLCVGGGVHGCVLSGESFL